MNVLWIILAGGAAGVLSGLFGVGGGAIFVPALVLLFGFEQTTAEGTSLLAMIPVAGLGAWVQHKSGLVQVRSAATVGLVAGLGVVVGAVVANHLPEITLRRIFAVFLVIMAGQLLLRSNKTRVERLNAESASGDGTV
ncbi:MAG: sulfite exporter TauE/SafE family protein [Solirubrobacterales bacterium]|nr:sulfite exporter TauE/SafE family protein [Solirubrobacterales bacterium]